MLVSRKIILLTRAVCLICFVLLATQQASLLFAQTNFDRSAQATTELEENKPIERELKAGDNHVYSLNLDAGHFVSVVVEQSRVNLVAMLFTPEGQQRAEVGGSNGSNGLETFSFVASDSGDYRIEVRPLDKWAAGRYEIRVETIRQATLQEKDREKVKSLAAKIAFAGSDKARAALVAKHEDLITVQLVRELNEYGRVFRNRRNYQPAQAVSGFTLKLAERIGDKVGVSDAIHSIGSVLFQQRDFSPALEYLQKSLALREQVSDNAERVDTLAKIAHCYQQKDNLEQALEYFRRSLAIDREIGGGRSADLLFSIGSLGLRMARDAEAIEAYQESLILYQESGNEIRQYMALARIYYVQSDFPTSLKYNQRVLALSEAAGDKANTAWTLNIMALSTRMLGDFANSMDYVEKAISISDEMDDKDLQANVSMAAGLLHHRLNNLTKAHEFYQKSLRLAEELKSRTLIAYARQNIGRILVSEGKYAEAMDNYQECLTLNEAVGNRRQFFYTLDSIGDLYQIRGDHVRAHEYRVRGLRISEELGNKYQITKALIGIASTHAHKGEFVQALEFAKRAAAVSTEIGELENRLHALYLIGLAYQGVQQFEQSGLAFEEAISAIESTRARFGAQDSRSAHFATHLGTYEAYIDLLMQMHRKQPAKGYDVRAFHVSQRARARSLLELLSESRAQIEQGVVPELTTRERLLQEKLNERAAWRTRLLSGRYSAEQAELLRKEIESLTAEYRNNQAQIRLKSPRYAALTQPQPLTAIEIQRGLLDTDTVLLTYALGGQRSYLWVVTTTSLQSYELPGRAEIEKDVRHVVGLLNDGKRWAEDKAIGAEFTQGATSLSRKLFPPDVLSQLKGKRLAIVADGALHYLPYGALPLTERSDSNYKKQNIDAEPLSVEFEIVSLSSPSALAVQRRETSNRKPPANSIAVFADPVFSETDERLADTKNERLGINRPAKLDLNRLLLERAFNMNGDASEPFSIPRLPFTRQEANGILSAASSTSSLRALDFKASRENVVNQNISNYRIVHFATHGILHSEQPELSGLVLSLVTEKGEPVNGFLRLNEIYNMKLNADLVVLSACQTALGKEVRGEGFIGLTRGFMYAGASRVVASLWKVDDVATAELMKIFYRKMLKENKRPAAALREAKIEMMRQKRWRAPYYWAAFELQGDWR